MAPLGHDQHPEQWYVLYRTSAGRQYWQGPFPSRWGAEEAFREALIGRDPIYLEASYGLQG